MIDITKIGHIYMYQVLDEETKRNESHYLTKIGYSCNIEKRLKQHESSLGRLRLIGKYQVKNVKEVESELHHLYSEFKVLKREFFDLTTNELQLIKDYLASLEKLTQHVMSKTDISNLPSNDSELTDDIITDDDVIYQTMLDLKDDGLLFMNQLPVKVLYNLYKMKLDEENLGLLPLSQKGFTNILIKFIKVFGYTYNRRIKRINTFNKKDFNLDVINNYSGYSKLEIDESLPSTYLEKIDTYDINSHKEKVYNKLNLGTFELTDCSPEEYFIYEWIKEKMN